MTDMDVASKIEDDPKTAKDPTTDDEPTEVTEKTKVFKSNLQVFLAKQDKELVKNIEYKKRKEEEEEEEEAKREKEQCNKAAEEEQVTSEENNARTKEKQVLKSKEECEDKAGDKKTEEVVTKDEERKAVEQVDEKENVEKKGKTVKEKSSEPKDKEKAEAKKSDKEQKRKRKKSRSKEKSPEAIKENEKKRDDKDETKKTKKDEKDSDISNAESKTKESLKKENTEVTISDSDEEKSKEKSSKATKEDEKMADNENKKNVAKKTKKEENSKDKQKAESKTKESVTKEDAEVTTSNSEEKRGKNPPPETNKEDVKKADDKNEKHEARETKQEDKSKDKQKVESKTKESTKKKITEVTTSDSEEKKGKEKSPETNKEDEKKKKNETKKAKKEEKSKDKPKAKSKGKESAKKENAEATTSDSEEKKSKEKLPEETHENKNKVDSKKEKSEAKPESKKDKKEDKSKAESKKGECEKGESTKTPSTSHQDEKAKGKENQEERRASNGNQKKLKEKEKVQGLLLKKGGLPFSSWKKYYWVLDEQLLTYYNSQRDYEALANFKGSLDLALLETVHTKKAGLMKSHFPFCLIRRNLKPINLAAETSEERDRWMKILQNFLQCHNRLSAHNSDTVLTSESSEAKERSSKCATLPSRMSQSEERPSSEDEEPVLIKPKKVQRVPIGGPLVPMNLGTVKLKKVEEQKTNEDVQAEKETEAAEPVKDPFGVSLKRVQKQEEEKTSKENDNKEEMFTNITLKRVNKQPVIPLTKSSLLSQPEEKSPKASPDTKKKGSFDKKRSPSPCIPLSKGVHSVVTKSGAEEVTTNEAEMTDVIPRQKTMTLEGAHADKITIHVAQSNEIRFSDDLLSMDDVPVIEVSGMTEDTNSSRASLLLQDPITGKDTKVLCDKEENVQLISQPEGKDGVNAFTNFSSSSSESLHKESPDTSEENVIPQDLVSVTVKEDSSEIQGYEVIDEEVLKTVRKSTPEVQPKPKKIEDQDNILKDADTAAMSKPSPTALHKTLESTEDSSSKDLQIQSTNEVKSKGASPPPTSPFRERSRTNESTYSSTSNSEESEKKSGKFKMFKIKRAASMDTKQSKPDVKYKEQKDKKHKAGALSRLLVGKKSKDRQGSDSKEIEEADTVEISSNDQANKQLPDERKIPQESTDKGKDDDNKHPPLTIVVSESEILSEADMKKSPKDINDSVAEDYSVVRRRNVNISGESRCSTYSRSSTTSKELDPPPAVPEKTRVREDSPDHDVPQSNRPISNMHFVLQQSKMETEDTECVDGYITQDQIDAILTAKETREKRRMSQSRGQGLLLVPESQVSDPNNPDEDWSYHRPSYVSVTSTESDEPLPKTKFLCDRGSSSSGSSKEQVKSYESDSSSESQNRLSREMVVDNNCAELEVSVPLRKSTRITDSLMGGPRVSLTSPEFTVLEEEGPSSPSVETKTIVVTSDEHSQSALSEITNEPDLAEVADNAPTQMPEKKSKEVKEKDSPDNEEEENGDYFPVIGGSVEIRQLSPNRHLEEGSSTAGMRTSGIVGLKAMLDEMGEGEDSGEIRTGINRLGHSVAVERLKKEAGDSS